MLGLTRILTGQAGGVVGDAAQHFTDDQLTAKTKVGQVSTAERIDQRVGAILHCEDPNNIRILQWSTKKDWATPVGPSSLMRDTTLGCSVLEWKRLPRAWQ
jgi:hypothetical protein